MSTFYVDVDLVAEKLRSTSGQLSVQGEARRDLEARGLTSHVLEESGPGGGNPLVRVYGSRVSLMKFLNDNDYEGCTIHPRVHRSR